MKKNCYVCHCETVHNYRKKKDLAPVCTKCGEGAGARKKSIYGFSKRMFGPGLRVSVKMAELAGQKRQMFYIRNGTSVVRAYNGGKDWVRESFKFDTVAKAAQFCDCG